MKVLIAAVAALSLLQSVVADADCGLDYVLFNADTDEPVGLLDELLNKDGAYCIPSYDVNIQARPTPECPTTLSAVMSLVGPVHEDRLENAGPYMIFGDISGDILGRSLRPGSYTIDSDIFSERGALGDLVVGRVFDFAADYCDITDPPTMAPKPAEVVKGYVKVVNLAPMNGTCQTPVWVGIHDGGFDTYDRNASISEEFERLVEDGNNAPLIDLFAHTPGTVWDGSVGMGPICPGDVAFLPFEIVVKLGVTHFFSYASMILPSNDAFVANGNPMAFTIFDEHANFVPVLVESLGSMALDGGTEVNDEIPENTAFFGQMEPDTGVDENGVVLEHPGFNPKGSGGILDAPMFANADFTVDGYRFMDIKVALGFLSKFSATPLNGDEEVPPVHTAVTGASSFVTNEYRTEITFSVTVDDNGEGAGILGGAGAHIHCGKAGDNGPVAVILAGTIEAGLGGTVVLGGTLSDANVIPTDCGSTIKELVDSMIAQGTYVNIHSVANPSGEVRGQIIPDH